MEDCSVDVSTVVLLRPKTQWRVSHGTGATAIVSSGLAHISSKEPGPLRTLAAALLQAASNLQLKADTEAEAINDMGHD